MRSGLATSVVLHAAILAWALFTIQAQRELRMAEPEPIVVDLVNASDLTRLRQGARDAKQLEAQPKEAPKTEPTKKEAPKPAPVATAPPPPPQAEAPKEEPKAEPKEEPKAEPKEEPKEEPKKEVASAPPPAPAPVPPAPDPDEQKKLDELLKEQERQAEEQRKLEEQKKIEEQRRLEEERKQAELKRKLEEEKRRKEAELKRKREEEKKRKEAEAKKKFDAEKIAALLNKVPDKGAPRPSVPLEEQAKALPKGPVLGAPEGRDRQVSASELAILAQRIRQCVQSKWNLLAGGESAQHTLVKIRLRFNPDGTLAAPPVIMNPQSTPYFLAVSDSAIRAAQACEPYSLPPDKYDLWKDIVLNFDPRDMF